MKKRDTPEGRVKYPILEWLSYQRDVLFFLVNNGGVYDPVKKIFLKKHGLGEMLGVADIIGCKQGRFFAIEVKSPKGVLSDHQKEFLLRVQASGGIAIVARSVSDVIHAFEEKFHG